MKAIRAFFFSSLLVCSLSTLLFAQSAAAATLSGVVVDPNGAVIQGATVTAAQKATGVKREATTNSEGIFVIPNLAAGDYEVKIQATGFAEKSNPLVVLPVGQTVAVDFTLEVGQITIADDFSSPDIQPINTLTSVVDGVITRRSIENLPLNGRNFLELALLIPGNSPAPNFDPTKTNTVVISSAIVARSDLISTVASAR